MPGPYDSITLPIHGVRGNSVLSGSGAPSNSLGVDGDFYLDTANTRLYSPKSSGAWGGFISLIGPTGSTGSQGLAGTSILNGTSAPSSGTGNNGDFYINTTTSTLYGPKTSGAWGSGISLVGPPGGVPTSRRVDTTSGELTGGGDLTADRTLGLAGVSGVSGTWTNLNATIDSKGRVTSAANGTGSLVSDVATLQGLTGTTLSETRQVLGYFSARDNGGPGLVQRTASGSTVDGIMVFSCADGGTARWEVVA